MLGLARGGQMVFETTQSHDSQRYHSTLLLPLIQNALSDHQLTLKDIAGIGVNLGPGSFTGIRTGLVIARLLGQFSPIQTFGFDAFELIAADERYRGQSLTILLNAFRQQHYHAALQVSDSGIVHWISQPQVLPNETPPAITTKRCLVDPSLEGKMDFSDIAPTWLGLEEPFTPSAMAFLLLKQPDRYRLPWERLLPLYLQLPNITVSKKQPPCLQSNVNNA